MRWRHLICATAPTSSVALRRQLPLIGEASGVSGKLHKGRCTAANLQVRYSIFFCFSKRKRWRVRNDHGGTSRRKRRLLSSVLVSSFPNRKLNLRFGFFYANLQQPLSQPSADSIPTPFVPSGHFPLIGGIGPWKGSQGGAHRRRFSELRDNLSVSCADSIPTPFVPSGHFPLIGGIGPWEGSRLWSAAAGQVRLWPSARRRA